MTDEPQYPAPTATRWTAPCGCVIDCYNHPDHVLVDHKMSHAEWKARDAISEGRTEDAKQHLDEMQRMWRTPNVVRENGNYKVPLTADEALNMTAANYLQLCAAPRSAPSCGLAASARKPGATRPATSITATRRIPPAAG